MATPRFNTPQPAGQEPIVFTYTLEDANGDQSTATVDVSINGLPIAVDEAVIIEQATSVQIDVLANDSDPDNESFSVTSVTQPTTGTTAIVTIQIPDLNDPNGWWGLHTRG